MSRAYRLLGSPAHTHLIEGLLTGQGYAGARLPFYNSAFELLAEPAPLGNSLAAKFGYIYIQDPSSMLPALALAGIAQKDGALPVSSSTTAKQETSALLALDMCASPGGKTSLLARLLGPGALVLANEPSPKRLATLRRNLELMNQFNTASISHQGQELPLPSAGGGEFAGFDYILLDPPCSGWGTVEKNPQVMELWQGERLGPLVGLQRLLLREAVRLLRPGGAIVYSTCTTNVQENEEQIFWALNELNEEAGGGLSLLPLAPFAGFDFEEPLPPLAEGATLRVSLSSGIGQGFYIAALRKSALATVLPPRLAAQPRTGKARRETKPCARAMLPVMTGAVDSPLCEASLLPPGSLFELNGILYFYHSAGCGKLPEGFNWRGFPLGKSSRLDSGLHGLMPSLAGAEARGGAVLEAGSPELVQRLISGQSLTMECPQGEVGLYLNGLPLCRLKARSGRVFI